MAKASQIKALLESAFAGDDARLYATAMQFAASAAHRGHGKLAAEIKDLVDNAKKRRTAFSLGKSPVPLVRPKGELAELVTASYPAERLGNMVLDDALRHRLDRILLETRQREEIISHGLKPRTRLLLMGPPGSGKTMTAAAMAGELRWPLLTIRLDRVITRYMGETAAKLRLIFDAMVETRGVYLFDEFDAIGGRRMARNDVGEIRRVLSSFLQFLEEESCGSLIVAATNHPSLLDKALFRRFDDVLEYGLPDRDATERVLRNTLSVLADGKLDWEILVNKSCGLSQAELVLSAHDALKEAILKNNSILRMEDVLMAITERRGGDRK